MRCDRRRNPTRKFTSMNAVWKYPVNTAGLRKIQVKWKNFSPILWVEESKNRKIFSLDFLLIAQVCRGNMWNLELESSDLIMGGPLFDEWVDGRLVTGHRLSEKLENISRSAWKLLRNENLYLCSSTRRERNVRSSRAFLSHFPLSALSHFHCFESSLNGA